MVIRLMMEGGGIGILRYPLDLGCDLEVYTTFSIILLVHLVIVLVHVHQKRHLFGTPLQKTW